MDRESLEKRKKEELIEIILGKEEMIKKLNDELYMKDKELSKSRFNETIYDEYVNLKKELEMLRENERLNDIRFNDLYDLLERYKNIVDRIGGKIEVY